MTAKLTFPVCLAIYLTLAAVSTTSHDFWRDRHWARMGADFGTVLAGEAKAPGQYRVMVPVLAQGLHELGFSQRAAVVALRFAFVALGAALLHGFLRRWFSMEAALVGVLLWFGWLPLTHLIYQMAWSDPANFAFTVLAYSWIAQRRDIALAALLGLAALNRETVVLLPLVWLFYRWDELPPAAALARFAGLCAVPLAVYFGVRLSIGPVPNAGAEFFANSSPLRFNLESPRAYLFFAMGFGALGIAALHGWSSKPRFLRRASLFVPPFIAFHYLVAIFQEPRLMLPVFPIALGLALASFAPARDEARPEPRTAAWLLRMPGTTYAVFLLAFLAITQAFAFRLTHSAPP